MGRGAFEACDFSTAEMAALKSASSPNSSSITGSLVTESNLGLLHD